MSTRLRLCPCCRVHMRDADAACPNCGVCSDAAKASGRAVAVVVAAVGLSIAGCAYGPPSDDFLRDTTTTTSDTVDLPDTPTDTVAEM